MGAKRRDKTGLVVKEGFQKEKISKLKSEISGQEVTKLKEAQ